MANPYFQFRQFTIYQDQCAMKVTTDGCLFGAWVARELREENKDAQQYLDIGAGTGLLPLMILQQNPGCRIDAIEIDTPAYNQAVRNITAAGRSGSVQLIHGDINTFNPGKKYDCIISNPPFYEKELKGDDTRKNIAHHNEGLLLPDLLKRCRELLKEDGVFYLLLPFKREREARVLLRDSGCTVLKTVLAKPAAHLGYFRILLKAGIGRTTTAAFSSGEICIKDEKGQYTAAFTDLLKDYYLFL